MTIIYEANDVKYPMKILCFNFYLNTGTFLFYYLKMESLKVTKFIVIWL